MGGTYYGSSSGGYGGAQPQQPEYPPATAWPQSQPQYQPQYQPPYAAPTPPPRKSGGGKALLIAGIAAGVLLLLCVGGGLIVALTADDLKLPDTSTTANAADPTADEDIQGNIDKYQKGDCLTINADNDVREAECTATGAYKVLLRKNGTIAESACDNTDATESLYQDGAIGTKDDFILCIAPVK